jgi:formiminoglutamase
MAGTDQWRKYKIYMKHFRYYSKQDILNITRLRKYETKLGELLKSIDPAGDHAAQILASSAKFVLFGIPEDIGIRANQGIGGADSAWLPFLHAIVNVQSSDRLSGEEILLLGQFDFSDVEQLIDLNAKSNEERIDALRHAVANIIDDEVEELMKIIISAGKIPIVIGGGHNNSYPLIKGAAKQLNKQGSISKPQINVVNLDAHADYRISEGRHSGNGFRYAKEESFMHKYAIVGLHENYNSQSMMDDLYSNLNIQYSSFEDIFIHEKMNFRQAVAQAFSFTDDEYTGVELDLDSIRSTLSSAISPVGITAIHARQYMAFAANNQKTAYLHICEGAARLDNGKEDDQTGKLISYLVTDFVKGG